MQEFNKFDEYIDEAQKAMEELKQRLSLTLKYIDIYRDAHKDSMKDKMKDDKRFVFFQNCKEDKELVLPILDYLHDQVLNL